MNPIPSVRLCGARAMVLLASCLGAIVVFVQLLKFTNQPSPAPAVFVLVLSAGLLALAKSSQHLFPVPLPRRASHRR